MKKLTIALSLIVFSTINTYSQSKKIGTELSEIRKNKNHLDLDIRNIFNGLGNATLLYKRTYQKGELIDVNSIRLIRISGRLNNQINFTDDPTRDPNDTTNVAFHPSNLIDIQLGIGFERQKMNKNFVHYYGIDGIFNFFKLDDDFSNGSFGGVTINSTGTTDRLLRTFRTGINPFLGIKYYFTNRLSIGIETGISILYFNHSITEIRFEQQFVNGQFENVFVEDEPVISNGIQTRFNNLRFLTIGYTF